MWVVQAKLEVKKFGQIMTQNLGSQDVAWVLRQFDIENYS